MHGGIEANVLNLPAFTEAGVSARGGGPRLMTLPRVFTQLPDPPSYMRAGQNFVAEIRVVEVSWRAGAFMAGRHPLGPQALVAIAKVVSTKGTSSIDIRPDQKQRLAGFDELTISDENLRNRAGHFGMMLANTSFTSIAADRRHRLQQCRHVAIGRNRKGPLRRETCRPSAPSRHQGNCQWMGSAALATRTAAATCRRRGSAAIGAGAPADRGTACTAACGGCDIGALADS